MADLLAKIEHDLSRRLAELRPFVTEAEQLEQALSVLGGPDREPETGGARGQAAPRRSETPAPRARRRRGQAREAVLAYLSERGPATAGEVAASAGLPRDSVSTLMSKLTKDGVLRKAERGYAVDHQRRAGPRG